ncbi:MAG: hypothetical protein A2W25_04765 [candidate division Zixibacteria bacterium RBG_16_53_22]|nr:MAG: hypothetical protein A2W25_04765 [candidate division Zixibacteria bacterium RBG_16_53_22]
MRELTPDVIKSLTPDQAELLVELGELAKKEEELTRAIEAIRRQEEKVGLKSDSRLMKAIYEDSEFDELLSLRAVRERFAVQDKIGGILRSLAAAGLGDLTIVRRQAPHYGVKLD